MFKNIAICITILFAKVSAEPIAESIDLAVVEKKISVQGKEAKILALVQPNGVEGIRVKKGELFDVRLKNELTVPTSIHWHGLILPNNQDGVAFITQFPLYPGLSYHYQFPLVQAGTFWMHSHFALQEQQLLSAPLIISGEDDASIASQEVVMALADFSFTPPSDIYERLQSPKDSMKMGASDIVEVDYDAVLCNYRTLDNPEIIKVEPGTKVRLRVINSSSATNFFIKTGALQGRAIAVDGERIEPYPTGEYELAVAQRIDIIVDIPREGGAFPILAVGEGTDKQTGLILTTADFPLPKLSSKAARKAGAFTNRQERLIHALQPLKKRAVDNKISVELGGNMAKYIWTMNGQAWPEVTPLVVEKGQRVEITFVNKTTMSHPMHLHGHVFQVTAINGDALDGAVRDTVLVMPNSSLTIQFDADNPGVWPLHCHILYHMEAGMFTVVRYKDFEQPL